MSLRINHNTSALNGHRNMVRNDQAMGRSLEKLSSGLKINRAADNAAGLVISEQLRAQLGGLKQAMNNTEQAITMAQTFEGALDEMNGLLSKMKSLALHAMNGGVADNAQRMADQNEYLNIQGSIDRIAIQTRFGGQALLAWDGVKNTNIVIFQIGEESVDSVSLTVSAMQAINLQFGAFAGVSTVTNASLTLGNISAAINAVTNLRGRLGAFQANTLETGLRSLSVTHENLTFAESVIRDVDFAEESAAFTRNQILVQSATAMMAQDNQLPQNVLTLLG